MIKAVQSQAALLAAKLSPKNDGEKKIEVEKTEKTDQVALIKEQIANGTYVLDMEKTAKSIASELLGWSFFKRKRLC